MATSSACSVALEPIRPPAFGIRLGSMSTHAPLASRVWIGASYTWVTRVLSGFTNVLLLAVRNGTISAFGVTVVLVAVGASGPVGARSADTLTGAGGPGATGRDAGKRSMPFGA